MRLSIEDHDRDSAQLVYVYPVLSRRAGGVSVGINLNPNNACNWRCVYCQVPDLVPGMAPDIDLARLESELAGFLRRVVHGDYLAKHVPEGMPEGSRVLKDVAFSGNGEPTGSKQFAEVVERVGKVMKELELAGTIQLVLITNGSLMHHAHVQRGLTAMKDLGGVVWFKVDSATDAGQALLNDAKAGVARTRANVEIAARICPTWIQTMMVGWKGERATHAQGLPSEPEQDAYLAFLRDLVAKRVPVQGVLLYGLARRSYQPEAKELFALPRKWMESFARRIEETGLAVQLNL